MKEKENTGRSGAVWDVALTEEEHRVFAAGVSPYLIRPEHLVYFWPAGTGIRSTASSEAVMDEAVEIYGGLLRKWGGEDQ